MILLALLLVLAVLVTLEISLSLERASRDYRLAVDRARYEDRPILRERREW